MLRLKASHMVYTSTLQHIQNMKFRKTILLVLFLTVFTSCENMATYEGVVVDSDSSAPIDSVKVLIVMHGTIQEHYGMEVVDSLSSQEREKIDNWRREGWTNWKNSDGKYIRFVPYLTDSLGSFNIGLHEPCIFGCPEYQIRFEKNGYSTFELEGDWKSQSDLRIQLKKNPL